MSTDHGLIELRRELERLDQVRLRLSEALLHTAAELESPGVPPSEEFLDQLTSYRSRLAWLSSRLSGERSGQFETTDDLMPMSRIVDAIQQREQRAEAQATIQLILPLRHVEIDDFAPLAFCQAEAKRLQEAIYSASGSDADQELDLIRLGQHPFNSLLALCDLGDQLSDAEWSEHNDRVTEAYGRQMSTALARGRIERASSPPLTSQDNPPQSISSSLVVNQAREAPAIRVVESPAIPAQVEIPGPPIAVAIPAQTQSVVPNIAPATNTPIPVAHPISQLSHADKGQSVTLPLPAMASSAKIALPLPARVITPSGQMHPVANDKDSIFGSIRISEESSQVATSVPPIASTESTQLKPLNIEPEIPADLIFDGPPLADSVFNQPQPPKKLQPVAMMSPTEAASSSAGSHVAKNIESSEALEKRLSSELLTLFTEDRLPLAAHVARCLEMKVSSAPPVLPSWMLNSLVLSRNVSYSTGEIARLLESELRNFRPEMMTDGDESHQIAFGLLLRTAALPAALLTDSNSAISILRAFRIAPGFSQLYNYCSRVALYGDRLNGQAAELFRPQVDAGNDSLDENVAERASEWLQEVGQRVVSYERTSPLFLHAHWTLTAATSVRHAEATHQWCKWQETLMLASRLLNPVIRNDEAERNQVKQEIMRINSSVRLEPLEVSQRNAGTGAPARGIVLPLEEMHDVLKEATDLANRWLRASSLRIPASAAPQSQDAIELKEEVLSRTDGVVSELTELWNAHTSQLVRTAITLCRNCVERIRDLFLGKQSLPWNEPDARHIMNAELLKIPGLELNEQWLPDVDPLVQEREIAAYLQRGEIEWSQAFLIQTMEHDHVATRMLLELGVWTDAKTVSTLREQREERISADRTAICHELDEMTSELDEFTREGVLSPTENELFLKRIQRLNNDITTMERFGSCRWQLDQLRSSLRRRRDQAAEKVHGTGLSGTALPSTSQVKQPNEKSSSVLTQSFLLEDSPASSGIRRQQFTPSATIPTQLQEAPRKTELPAPSNDDSVVFATDIFSGD